MNEGAKALDLPFADVDHAFRMIETGMEPVIVPYNGDARTLIEELSDTARVRDIARKLQPYTVNVPRETFTVLRRLGRVQPINEYRFKDRFMVLTEEAKTALYRKEDGFDFSDPAYQGVENLVF